MTLLYIYIAISIIFFLIVETSDEVEEINLSNLIVASVFWPLMVAHVVIQHLRGR